ncbi:metal-dependent hydrolase [Candidatus Shikimatogenerans silvanidophilus]|uniref:metal-dependent hydrolase n=1 Tax=Candidatus Shikimatogenerans silvanidophilus TaxID=2782547 RepID=UPI001BA8DA69|nr:metal-dependent hydrolase [Candidatus Shikimatogenerans silvanidophilus]
MNIIFYSHSTFSLKIDNLYLLFDPFITKNPNILKYKKKYILNHLFSLNLKFILISHAHYDHVCDVELIAKKMNSIIISNYEITNFYSKKGLKTIPINYGSFLKIDCFKIKYVWACHSSTFEDGSSGGNPGGFLIKKNKKIIYFSGDTSLNLEMKLIPFLVKNPINLAIFPLGGVFTMDFKDAIIASDYVKCNKILGVHYNTFPSISIDNHLVKKNFKKNKKKLILLDTFEKINI